MKIWIRRGYGPFLQMPSEVKARRKAAHWHEHGGGGSDHPVIGLFIGTSKYAYEGQREELYDKDGNTCVLQGICLRKYKHKEQADHVLVTPKEGHSGQDSEALEGDESPGASSR